MGKPTIQVYLAAELASVTYEGAGKAEIAPWAAEYWKKTFEK
jgi:hypothetical protein